MSAYHPVATAKLTFRIGRFVPLGLMHRSKTPRYSITSSARAK